MSPASTEILSNFFRSFSRAHQPLLLLDYDGTLAPFKVDRFQAVPWPGVRELLNLIHKRTRIVVVSGRPAAEIKPLLALDDSVEIWGLHGFERVHADGRRELEHLPKAIAEQLSKVQAQLQRDSFGGLFEAKPNAAVMHWRGLPHEQAALVALRTRALFEPISGIDGFKLLPFEAGLELRVGRDKSAAVEALLPEHPGSPAAYLGDDLTDEAAFHAIKGRGLSVLVRPEHRSTAADVWLKPPEELIDFLERWLEAAQT